MECLKCGSKTKVLESRDFIGTKYRKRRCMECAHTFWTVEDEAPDEEVRELLSYMMDKRRSK